MMDFLKAVAYIINHEGGFTDDPDDSGNWTGGISAFNRFSCNLKRMQNEINTFIFSFPALIF